jgi:hypothetical protein
LQSFLPFVALTRARKTAARITLVAAIGIAGLMGPSSSAYAYTDQWYGGLNQFLMYSGAMLFDPCAASYGGNPTSCTWPQPAWQFHSWTLAETALADQSTVKQLCIRVMTHSNINAANYCAWGPFYYGEQLLTSGVAAYAPSNDGGFYTDWGCPQACPTSHFMWGYENF